eukprot:5854119-Pleurochrysis_carterae.AAC.3
MQPPDPVHPALLPSPPTVYGCASIRSFPPPALTTPGTCCSSRTIDTPSPALHPPTAKPQTSHSRATADMITLSAMPTSLFAAEAFCLRTAFLGLSVTFLDSSVALLPMSRSALPRLARGCLARRRSSADACAANARNVTVQQEV